ncbi:MAG: sugar nucleotide-binding protein [Verrucomicrobiota bacterium]
MKVLILGATGYVGQAFVRYFENRNLEYVAASRQQIDYTRSSELRRLIEESKPTFLVNAAGYTGKPNVDACETDQANCLFGNAVFPGWVSEVCTEFNLPWGHVSSGCIFTGSRPDGSGFTEEDPPNFSFRQNNCSYYSGTKALAEEALANDPNCFIWRLRIPFNHEDSPRNYLSKLMRYSTLLEARNSITHLDEFAQACSLTWEKRVPFGTYNITNTGSVLSSEVTAMIQKFLAPNKAFTFFPDEETFMQKAASAPRSNCVLDSSKLINAGIPIRPVEEALETSLKNWIAEASPASL